MADYIGRETTIEAGGKTYKLSRYDRDILDKYTDWCRDQLPSPFEDMKKHIRDFPPNVQEIMIKEAVKNSARKRGFDDPMIQDVMKTGRGVIKLLSLLLQKNHPDLTDKDAGEIFDKVFDEKGQEYLTEKVASATARFQKSPSDIEREALQDFGLIPKDQPEGGADWQRIDKIILAHTSLKPWELGHLTVPEVCFLIVAIMEKDNPDGTDSDPVAVQDKINKAMVDAAIYRSLTLDQKLEIARREIED